MPHKPTEDEKKKMSECVKGPPKPNFPPDCPAILFDEFKSVSEWYAFKKFRSEFWGQDNSEMVRWGQARSRAFLSDFLKRRQ